MNDIILERHGELVGETFYWIGSYPAEPHQMLIGEHDRAYPESETKCPVSKEHQTESIWRKFSLWLAGGPKFSEIIPLPMQDSAIVITQWLADRLRATSFRGFSLIQATVTGDVPPPRNEPLFVINFHGKRCFRHWKLVSKKNNSCPFCGRGPLVCPTCNEIVWHCPGCGQHPVDTAGSIVTKDAHVLSISRRGEGGPDILEGDQWDGSDFVSGGRIFAGRGLVSLRVVVWLMSLNVLDGYLLDPVVMDVSKMTADQRKKLDEVCKVTPDQLKRLNDHFPNLRRILGEPGALKSGR